MEWIRGELIGRGSFGTVSLASSISNSNLTHQFVVKSSECSTSFSLRNEKEVLSELMSMNHPNIIRCLGDSLSYEKGTQMYNLFLEYATEGSLAHQLKCKGGRFEFYDIKRYTSCILKGLSYIHQRGFVHCDVKLQNILLFNNGVVKIADFGLSRRVSDDFGGLLRGTPIYMSPEIITGGKVESPADIWALGCAVIEMFSGEPAWKLSPESDVSALLYRVAIGGELPNIPGNMCDEGKDFVRKCFIKNPNERWTAQMLLEHPCVSGLNDVDDSKLLSISPRCPFEFSNCQSSSSLDTYSISSFGFLEDYWSPISRQFDSELISDVNLMPNWSDTNGWISVR